jgi:CubicO group peptidase (beta-lactamase class C family)
MVLIDVLRAWLACALCLVAAAPAAAQPETPWPTRQWTVSTPEAQGLDSAALAAMVDHLATPSFNTDSVIAVRHGRIVSESYAAPFHAGLRHDQRSVTKSVVATLVGAAIQQGKIASDQQKVLGYFPDHPANGPAQDAMTLRHLLDMTTGIAWREWPYNAQADSYKLWAAKDWAGFLLAREVPVPPGDKFQYMAAAPHLLSVVLTRATGSNAADYARGHVFKALGIEDFAWRADPQGHSVGESALRLKPRDMARLGLLHLRGGRWDGQQLLPPGWAEALFASPGVTTGLNPLTTPPTYRGLWWTDASVPYAAAMGRHGQLIVLLPKQDLMLVVTSKTADSTRGASPVELVQRYLLPAVKSNAALPANRAAGERLAQAVQRFSQPQGPASQTPSAQAREQARRNYVLEANAWGYREFRLELDASEPHYRLLQADRSALRGESRRGGAIGIDGRYLVSPVMADRLWARRGRWIDEDTYRIETQQMESAIIAEWTARFLPDGTLELHYADGDGEALTMRGRVKD